MTFTVNVTADKLQICQGAGHTFDPLGSLAKDASAPSKDGKKKDTRLNLVGLNGIESKIKVNIRQGAVRHACDQKTGDSTLCRRAARDAGINIKNDQYVRIPVNEPAWSPVWNAAVHSNTIEEHGGYLLHTLWCVLNRFALDKPLTTPLKDNSNEQSYESITSDCRYFCGFDGVRFSPRLDLSHARSIRNRSLI